MFSRETNSPFFSWSSLAAHVRGWRHQPDFSEANDFDCAQWGDVSLSPNHIPDLLGCQGRALGEPSELFSGFKTAASATSGPTQQIINWRQMIERLKFYSPRGQVAGVHSYINQMNGYAGKVASLARSKPWTGLLNQCSWPTPETDKALAKYISLRLLGFHADRLRLILADGRLPAQDGVVLAVFFGGKAFVLNQGGDIMTDERLSGFFPCCSLNARQFYLHWAPNSNDSPAHAAKRLLDQFGLAAA